MKLLFFYIFFSFVGYFSFGQVKPNPLKLSKQQLQFISENLVQVKPNIVKLPSSKNAVNLNYSIIGRDFEVKIIWLPQIIINDKVLGPAILNFRGESDDYSSIYINSLAFSLAFVKKNKIEYRIWESGIGTKYITNVYPLVETINLVYNPTFIKNKINNSITNSENKNFHLESMVDIPFWFQDIDKVKGNNNELIDEWIINITNFYEEGLTNTFKVFKSNYNFGDFHETELQLNNKTEIDLNKNIIYKHLNDYSNVEGNENIEIYKISNGMWELNEFHQIKFDTKSDKFKTKKYALRKEYIEIGDDHGISRFNYFPSEIIENNNQNYSVDPKMDINISSEVEEIYSVTQDEAMFPGGKTAFNNFLKINLEYPQNAKKSNVQGSVFIQFLVKKDGTLDQFKIIKSIGFGCDEEVLRIMEKSPRWIPGKQNGQNVNSIHIEKIEFILPN